MTGPRPHDPWADVYDLAYEEEFGAFYATLTQGTVEAITGLLPPQGSIVDFGAGTGRLAIPPGSRKVSGDGG